MRLIFYSETQAEFVDPNRFSAWSSHLARLVLGVAAAWIWGSLFWQAATFEPPTLNTAARDGTAKAGPGATATNLSDLHLFGRGAGGPGAGFVSSSDTTASITVIGILTGKQPRAFIALNDGTQRALALNDAIPGGGEVREIHADHIVIVRNGRETDVPLAKPESMARAGSYAGGTRSRASSRARSPVPGIRSGPTRNSSSSARLQGNPLDLARNIRALPYTENGRQVGVRLQSVGNGQLLSRMGLSSTDVITSVNGISLDSPARNMEVLQQLTSTSQFTVGVRRDGKPVTLNIDLNDS